MIMMKMVLRPRVSIVASILLRQTYQVHSMVSLHGSKTVTTSFSIRQNDRVHKNFGEKPADPTSLLNSQEQQEIVQQLSDWWGNKQQVLCLTGAGISTESGIPDYRGNQGSYHKGHKPMVHDQFMRFEDQRKRYWGRGLVGWKSFDETVPNSGHLAIAKLEEMGRLGVVFDDAPEFYSPPEDSGNTEDEFLGHLYSTGQRKLALITQNVDTLHRRAGSEHLIELHGRTDQLKCMKCGSLRSRRSFHSELESLNEIWLAEARSQLQEEDLRADGDAVVRSGQYNSVKVPACSECPDGFLKPDVVFFGDAVPKTRVAQCRAAVQNADGLLVVGSSLAVHSAFQHVRAASKRGIPIAIVNVGETRAQIEGIDALYIEAPAGPTLSGLVEIFEQTT